MGNFLKARHVISFEKVIFNNSKFNSFQGAFSYMILTPHHLQSFVQSVKKRYTRSKESGKEFSRMRKVLHFGFLYNGEKSREIALLLFVKIEKCNHLIYQCNVFNQSAFACFQAENSSETELFLHKVPKKLTILVNKLITKII